jgi:uncharacterized membrane protein YGL010W
VGVPLIVVTLVGLLSRVSLGPVSLALPVALAALLYQLRLTVKLTVPFAGLMALSFLIASRLSTPLLWGGFIVGWVLQFVGHYVYEKKSPAFTKNLQELVVGPLWLVQEAISGKRTSADSPDIMIRSFPLR